MFSDDALRLPRIPDRDVHVAVAIEVAEVGAFSPKLVDELGFLERVKEVLGICERKG